MYYFISILFLFIIIILIIIKCNKSVDEMKIRNYYI